MAENSKTHNVLITIALKLGEYGTIFLVAWQLLLPAAQDWVHEEIEKAREERKKVTGKWLSEQLLEEYNVTKDRLHIYMGEQNKKLDTLYAKFNRLSPYLQEEMQYIVPRLIVKNGREFWKAEDGEEYRVDRSNEHNIGFYWKDGGWRQIFQ